MEGKEVLATAYRAGYKIVPMGEASLMVWVKEATPKDGTTDGMVFIRDTTMERVAEDLVWFW